MARINLTLEYSPRSVHLSAADVAEALDEMLADGEAPTAEQIRRAAARAADDAYSMREWPSSRVTGLDDRHHESILEAFNELRGGER